MYITHREYFILFKLDDIYFVMIKDQFNVWILYNVTKWSRVNEVNVCAYRAGRANTASANNPYFNPFDKNWVFMLLVSVSQIKPHYFYAKCPKIEWTRGDAEMFYEDYLWECQQNGTHAGFLAHKRGKSHIDKSFSLNRLRLDHRICEWMNRLERNTDAVVARNYTSPYPWV